jgi:hypothetical protein
MAIMTGFGGVVGAVDGLIKNSEANDIERGKIDALVKDYQT